MPVSQKEKMFFVEHLSLMVKGGIPITESLETLKNESKSRTFRKAIDDILKRILEGEKLNKSLERHPGIFNKFFRSIVKVGEESGTLEENLKYLSLSLRSEYSLGKKLIGALIYPIFIITIAVVVVLVISFFILPKLLNLFRALNLQLPLATKILLGVGGFLHDRWLLIIIGIFFLFLIFKIVYSLKPAKFYIHKKFEI